MSPLRVAIYGMGRAGSSLAASMKKAGLAPALLYNRNRPRARIAADALGLPVQSGPVPAAGGADLIVLAISDTHIADFCDDLLNAGPVDAGAVVTHLSGALSPSILDRRQPRGWHVGAMHPLRSLVGTKSLWRGAFCGLGGETQAIERLREIMELLQCPWALIEDERRALYHAAASLAANDLLALIHAAQQGFAAAGLSPEQALNCACDLSQVVIGNASRLGPAAALTGPLRRGDVDVVRAQDQALRQHSAQSRELHRACSRYLQNLVSSLGGNEEHRAAIEAFLTEA